MKLVAFFTCHVADQLSLIIDCELSRILIVRHNEVHAVLHVRDEAFARSSHEHVHVALDIEGAEVAARDKCFDDFLHLRSILEQNSVIRVHTNFVDTHFPVNFRLGNDGHVGPVTELTEKDYFVACIVL